MSLLQFWRGPQLGAPEHIAQARVWPSEPAAIAGLDRKSATTDSAASLYISLAARTTTPNLSSWPLLGSPHSAPVTGSVWRAEQL